jgi:hypothetical protein
MYNFRLLIKSNWAMFLHPTDNPAGPWQPNITSTWQLGTLTFFFFFPVELISELRLPLLALGDQPATTRAAALWARCLLPRVTR